MYEPSYPLQFAFSDEYSPPRGDSLAFRLGEISRVCEIFRPQPGDDIRLNLAEALSDTTLDFAFVDKCWPPLDGSGPDPEPPDESSPQQPFGTAFAWSKTSRCDVGCALPWGHWPKKDRTVKIVFTRTQRQVKHSLRLPWSATEPIHTEMLAPWRSTQRANAQPVASFWGDRPARDCAFTSRWSGLHDADIFLHLPWRSNQPHDLTRVFVWRQFDRALDADIVLPWRNSLPAKDILHRAYWGRQLYERLCRRKYQIPAGTGVAINLHTLLSHVGDGDNIDFYFEDMSYDLRCSQREPSGWRDNYIYIKPASWPVTPQYLVLVIMNSASLIRVSDNMPIEVFSMSAQADIDSWCWRFTARIPAASLPLVDPSSDPVEVMATINGYSWRFMIESWAEQKRFGNAEYTITGRSTSAELATPYAPLSTGVNSNQITSVQIAEEQLLNTGWTIDFAAFDSWLVPPGAQTWNNMSPLKVIQAVAEATGGRLQTHRQNTQLIVRPRLHSLPWNWPSATPDLSISDYVVRQLSREFMPGVAYNAVFVSGETQGVLCKVYRAGSAGDRVAPMVTDALLTETAPCRARGKMIIGRSGKWSKEKLELPLTAPGDLPGLLETGMLVSMTEGGQDWRGQVVGVDISAVWQSGKGIIVNQNIDVERYRGN